MNPFTPLVQQWLKKLTRASEFKKQEFQEDADECYRFFDGTYEWIYNLREMRRGFVWSGTNADLPKPSFCMTLNKVAELVEIFGPVLYHRNPTRTISPRKIPEFPLGAMLDPSQAMNPQMQMAVQMQAQQIQQIIAQSRYVDGSRAMLLEHYLNYTPEALDLKRESRLAIDEALIKGMGVMWTEVYRPPSGQGKMIGSFFDTVDNLILDPDGTKLSECKWAARRRIVPVWQCEREFGIPPGTLKGHMESIDMQSTIERNPELKLLRAQGRTNDLIVFWDIYSKMGMGARLSGVDPSLKNQFDVFGDFCYLAITEGNEFPLNLQDSLIASGDVQKIMQAAGWATPFWADDAWPFTPIVFHERPGKLWPMSHIKPALGELKFLNWAYSFMAGKIKTTCRDFIAMKKGLAEELKSAVLHGTDMELLEIESEYGTISEAVGFLQHPAMNADIFKVLEIVEQNFEKRVGLTELVYGDSSRQLRSAQEANIKSNQMAVRPDDMAMKVEEASSDLARREALAARWHLAGQDVINIMGQYGAQAWDKLVTASDPSELLYQLEYRVEEGSAKKPNKDKEVSDLNTAMQTLFQPFWQLASATGNFAPYNALIEAWGKAMDLDVSKFLIQGAMPMPPSPQQGQGQGQPAQQQQGPPQGPGGQ